MVPDLRTIVPNVVWCCRAWCLKQLYFCYSLLFETFVYIQPVYCFKRCIPAGAVLLCQRCGRCFKHCSWRISACCLKRYPAFQDVAFQTLFICSSLFCCSVVWNVVFILICMLFQTFFFPAFWNGAESLSGMSSSWYGAAAARYSSWLKTAGGSKAGSAGYVRSVIPKGKTCVRRLSVVYEQSGVCRSGSEDVWNVVSARMRTPFLEAVADEGRRRVAPVKRHVPNVYFQFLHLALFCPHEAQKGENCWSLNGLCVAALWPNCFCFRRIPYFWHEFGLFLSGKGKIFGLIPVYLRPHCGQTCSAVYGAVQQARRALQGNFRKNEA